MTNEPTHTIYSCLAQSFWTQRQCSKCQNYFTKEDFAVQNYQLTFRQVLTINQNTLSVLVQLTHKFCCSECISYRQEIGQTYSN